MLSKNGYRKLWLLGKSAGILLLCGTWVGPPVLLAQDDEVDPMTTIGQLNNPAGIDLNTFDRSVRIQDDLYRFVNGAWLNTTDIPSDKSNYGAFTALADIAQKRIREIIEAAAASENPPGSEADKVGQFYRSYLDVETIEQLGVKPLQPLLNEVAAVKERSELLGLMGRWQKIGVGGPVGLFVGVDNRDSTRYLANAMQSGTTLPDRDFYLEDDPKYAEARTELVAYVDRLLSLAGIEAPNAGQQVLEIETDLARAQWTRVQLRDANARYNKFQVAKLSEVTGDFEWSPLLTAVGLGEIDELNVMTPSFFTAFADLFEKYSVDRWQQYMTYKLLDAYASALPKDFADAHFRLHDQVLAGVPAQQPRWKQAVDATAGAGAGSFGVLGEAVGKLYVEQNFKPESKAKMEQLVGNLMEAYRQSINDLNWMTDATKQRAQEKLSKFTTKIGYPNKWRDYSKLEIVANDLIGNLMRSANVEHERMIERLGQPVDREIWGMTPQTVNAYYNPTMNEIVFPAAILQPPFFNPQADDAVNYGGIGAVIGHEISHGFDDQGSKYDGDGNLNNWWTDEDRTAFGKLTKALVDQYSEYEPLPEKFVNGQLTLGENIADLSGLTIAYKAYKLSLGGQPSPELMGWTGEQRFFLGWSQVWRRKYRDAEMVRRLLIDSHSPSLFRANGPVTNISAFQEAFQLKPGDALYKPESERLQIW
jgi:putative endopeptidase